MRGVSRICTFFVGRRMSPGRLFAVMMCSACLVVLLFGIRLSFVPNWHRALHVYNRKHSEIRGHSSQHVDRTPSAVKNKNRIVPLKFFPATDDKFFLYSEVLSKDHSFNRTNINSFRETFRKISRRDGFIDLITDQNNTEVGSKLFYYIHAKRIPHFKVTEEFHEKLPKTAKLGDMKRCSVVGNSGILANSTCGGSIDRSDFVFRCNAAPLEPFAKDAGEKSNVTSLNPSILNSRYGGIKEEEMLQRFVNDMQQYKGILLASCFGTRTFIHVCLKAFNNYISTENIFAMAHPEYFRKMTGVWKQLGLTARPSTGFYLATAAICICEEVHLYGFWPFSESSDRDVVPYHYFDSLKSPSELKVVAHDMGREFATLLRLHALGVIRLHVGNCS